MIFLMRFLLLCLFVCLVGCNPANPSGIIVYKRDRVGGKWKIDSVHIPNNDISGLTIGADKERLEHWVP